MDEKRNLKLIQPHLETDVDFAEMLINQEQERILYMTIFVCLLILLINLLGW